MGFIIFLITLALAAVGFFAVRFILALFSGKWENGGLEMASTIRKFATVITGLMFVGAFIFTIVCFVKWIELEIEFIHFLVYAIGAFSVVAIYCAVVLFFVEMETERFEAHIKTEINTGKIYRLLSQKEAGSFDMPTEASGALPKSALEVNGWLCDSCGTKNGKNSVFCNNCGKKK